MVTYKLPFIIESIMQHSCTNYTFGLKDLNKLCKRMQILNIANQVYIVFRHGLFKNDPTFRRTHERKEGGIHTRRWNYVI